MEKTFEQLQIEKITKQDKFRTFLGVMVAAIWFWSALYGCNYLDQQPIMGLFLILFPIIPAGLMFATMV